MGNNVLIIGASGDIGLAISERLVNDGFNVLLHYNENREKIDAFRNKLNGEAVLAVMQADLSNNDEIKRFLAELVLPVDNIVFASGAGHYGLLQDTSEMVMDAMLTLNVKAPWMITKHLLPRMIQNRNGKIVFITSIWGSSGASYEVIYSSVKGAQNSFVKALAKEVAPSGITVNAVSPGYIETKMNSHLSMDEKVAILADIPVNRAGLPTEIAHSVSFLLDDRSSYIQGEIINITGGW
ncbi:elongation factor P 5-aminopentanone reductase [Oceanobacillus saliphilus]|uniref:elongation factor P 5-aminopentanone reductase n=1 Tax=Oceanobacillus saliphilus TaxID=2925834 RepID=UPI00201DEEF4|nr:SDR family oxidoreductase [Oceanobacillus saliphilus]